MTFAYLATPYTNYPHGRGNAIIVAARLVERLIRAGHVVYSPICHFHPVYKYSVGPEIAHAQWLALDELLMRVASRLLVAHLDGWDKSAGIAHEVMFFGEYLGKPIFDLDPGTLEMVERKRDDYKTAAQNVV